MATLASEAIRNRPTASKLASARSASASCCVRSHYYAIPSLHRPLSRPGAATENPLRRHIGPNGAQAFSLVGSLIPICPAFTPPIGGFGLILLKDGRLGLFVIQREMDEALPMPAAGSLLRWRLPPSQPWRIG